MAGREKDLEELEVTAQPKGLPDELGMSPVQDPGLSIDPEDLGRQFLTDATEQHNFESLRGGETSDLWITSASGTDDAMPGPNFEADKDVWESTVDLSLQRGGPQQAQTDVAASLPDDDDEQRDREDGLHAVEGGELDLTESVIPEKSLFDREAEQLGETTSPEIHAEDTKSHAKRRGGHAKGTRSQHRGR